MIPTTNKTALGKTMLGIVARPDADRVVRHNSDLGNSRRPGPWIFNSLVTKNFNPGEWYSILHNRPIWDLSSDGGEGKYEIMRRISGL